MLSEDRYPIDVLVDSETALRKGRGKRGRRELEAFRAEVQKQLDEASRSPMSGEVSVFLDLHLPPGRDQPHLPTTVKAYLDALQGLAYGDDRRVAHLLVHRYSMDHPSLRGLEASMNEAELEEAIERGTTFFAEVMDLEDYVARYDRAFRRTMFSKDHTPWWGSWKWSWQVELGQLKAQRKARLPRGEKPSPELDEHIRFLEEDFRLGAAVLAGNDRPGPLPRGIRYDRALARLRQFHDSTVVLSLPGQESGTSGAWKEEVRSKLRAMRGGGTPFKRWVALDIAVRGTSLNGKDLDNLAHGVLTPLEEELCAERGTVSCYRVYRAEGEPSGVQVRVMTQDRMLDLEITIGRYGLPNPPVEA